MLRNQDSNTQWHWDTFEGINAHIHTVKEHQTIGGQWPIVGRSYSNYLITFGYMWLHLVTFGYIWFTRKHITPCYTTIQWKFRICCGRSGSFGQSLLWCDGSCAWAFREKDHLYCVYWNVIHHIYIYTNTYIHRYLLHSTYSTTSICNMKYQCYTDMNDVCIM